MYLPTLSHLSYFSNPMYVYFWSHLHVIAAHLTIIQSCRREQGKVFTCISQNCHTHFSISFVKCVYPKLYLWLHLHVNAAHLTIIQKWSLGTENKVNQRGGENYTTSGSQPLHFLQTTLNGFF